MATPARDLKDKLILEAAFRPVLDAYNNRIVRKFTRQWLADGTVLTLDAENEELAGILNKQYRDVGEVFDKRITAELPDDVATTDAEKATISAALTAFFFGLSKRHAREINGTTEEDAAKAVTVARLERDAAVAEGHAITRLETVAIAGGLLHRSLRGRLITTVATETQVPAETAKATEAEVLSGMPASVAGGSPRQSQVEKEWVSVGDSRVREAHLSADGQQRKINQPFDVGGEQLSYPGDASLGATAGNIINCRCSAGYDEQGIIETRTAQERDA